MFHGGTSHFATYQLESRVPCFGTPSRSKGVRSFSTPLQGVAHNGYRSRQGDSALENSFEETHIIGWDGILPPHLQGRPNFKAYYRMSRFTTPYALKQGAGYRLKVFDVETFCLLVCQGLRCFTVALRESGWNDLFYHSERGRRFGVPFQSVRRMCSRRIKFCIQWGLGYSP